MERKAHTVKSYLHLFFQLIPLLHTSGTVLHTGLLPIEVHRAMKQQITLHLSLSLLEGCSFIEFIPLLRNILQLYSCCLILMLIHLVVYTVSAFPPPGNMNTVKFTKDQPDGHQPQPIFQTLRGLLCMQHGLSVQLSKVTRVLPGPPFPVARLGLLSVCLGRI